MSIEHKSEKIKISARGFKEIQKKIETLQKERLITLDRRNIAREFGDLKENSEYSEAQQRLSNIAAEMDEYIQKLELCIVFDKIDPTDFVSFGCKVTIENTDTKQRKTYYILSEYESDIDKNILSNNSPIAITMNNKKINDTFSLANGKQFLIVDLSYPDNYDELYD